MSDRKLLIRTQILKILSECGGYLLPEATLRTHADILIPGLLRAEFAENLSWLESSAMVVGIRPDLGGDPRWKITDLGKAQLA